MIIVGVQYLLLLLYATNGLHPGLHHDHLVFLPFSTACSHGWQCISSVPRQSITEKHFVGRRINLYPNHTASVRYRLLVAGDINPNPGPSSDINTNNISNSSTAIHPPIQTTTNFSKVIKYSREDLLNLNSPDLRMPVGVWRTVKDLKLNVNRPTRRKKRHGRRMKISRISSHFTEISRNNVRSEDLPHDVPARVLSANNKPTQSLKTTLIDNDSYMKFQKKGFHCVHLNARSLSPKISEIKILASEIMPSIFGISESWLDDSITNREIEIPGFSVIRNDRKRDGGGVCIYVHSSLAFNTRSDLLESNLEAVWVEIMLPKSKPLIVGVCYRSQIHPEADFIAKLDHVLSKISIDSDIVILGDMNMCSLKFDAYYKKYQDMLKMTGCRQLIFTPTRVTATSKSAVDHVICNNMQNIQNYGVIKYGVSDHYMTFCSKRTSSLKVKTHKHNEIQIRSTKKYDKNEFVNMLNNANWYSMYSSDTVDDAWLNFRDIFTATLDSVAPLKRVRIRNHSDPWITSEILESIRERDSWLRRSRKDRHDPDHYEKYRQARNRVQNEIRIAKRQYMVNKIDENKDNPKQLWKYLKDLGYQCNSKESGNIVLEVDGKKYHDKKSVANHFNEFFTQIASKLVSELPKQNNLMYNTDSDIFKDLYKHVQANAFQLQDVCNDFIFKELCSLNVSKSTGLDSIPARFLKDAAEIITGPITFIVNMSLRSGTFPNELKKAKVIPLYKKKSRLDAGNYRPVSVLSIVSKILEKAVFNQLNKYLVEKNLIYQFQSGFRGSYSTDTCLIHLQDHIRKETAAGKFTGMILLDIQKAFDSVDHNILCKKLSALGVQSTAWFHSYLSDRKQIVNISGVESDPLTITCGVPQGSILGPLLFLCYVNDMSTSINCLMLQYADDSAIIFSDKDPEKISHVLRTNLESCNKWLIENKLSLHMGKTELILFGSKRKLTNYHDFSIVLSSGQIIKSKQSVVYLGLELNQYLDGEQIVLNILKKVHSRLRFLYRQANYFNAKVKKTICSALVLCLFDYSISSWYGGISKYYATKLQCAQNKIIRFILKEGFKYHINHSDFEDLGLLNINTRAKQLRLNHIFNIFNDVCPDYMKQNFTRVTTVHNHNTRGSRCNFHVPKSNTHSNSSYFYNAIKDWNGLPDDIKSISQKSVFKVDVKSYLLNNMDV